MIKHVIIVFERPDITAVKLILQNIVEAEVWVFDPHLLDDLALAQIPNAQYINCQVDFELTQFEKEMQAEALSIEAEIEKILKNDNDNDNDNFKYWQHLNWYFLQFNLNGYSQLWDSLLKKSLDNYHFHIPVYDRAAVYYLPSFIPAIMLLERFLLKEIPFNTYSHSTLNNSLRLLPVLNDGRINYSDNILVHMPTCIYDNQFINAEFATLNKNIIVFQSQDWNLSLPNFEQTKLESIQNVLDKISNNLDSEINHKIDLIENYLAIYFKKYLSSQFFIERQAKEISERYRALLVFFNYLEDKFSSFPPDSIILSSHDAGLHGAFYSFADKYNIKIIIFPHAKVINMPIEKFYIDNLITLSHPIQGSIVENIDKKLVNNLIIKYPENISFPFKQNNSLTTIGLIINKFSNDGFSLINTDLYLSGLKIIIEWCTKYNINLKFRLKPGGTCFKWLSENLNLSIDGLIKNTQVSLKDFASTTDVCLMYDAPTSGAAELLANSIPLIGITNRKLLPAEAAIVSENIVPRLSIEKALELLVSFVDNEINLIDFRSNQFLHYFSKFKSGTSFSKLY